MKKLTALLLVGSLVFTMAGCGSSSEPASSDTQKDTSGDTTAETTATATATDTSDAADTSVQADRYGTFADKENVWNRYI